MKKLFLKPFAVLGSFVIMGMVCSLTIALYAFKLYRNIRLKLISGNVKQVESSCPKEMLDIKYEPTEDPIVNESSPSEKTAEKLSEISSQS